MFLLPSNEFLTFPIIVKTFSLNSFVTKLSHYIINESQRSASRNILLFLLAVRLGEQSKTNDYRQLISIKQFISLEVFFIQNCEENGVCTLKKDRRSQNWLYVVKCGWMALIMKMLLSDPWTLSDSSRKLESMGEGINCYQLYFTRTEPWARVFSG